MISYMQTEYDLFVYLQTWHHSPDAQSFCFYN